MPVVEITLIEGRSNAAKERLHAKVAQAVHEALDAPIESIRVILREVPGAHFSVGGVAKSKTAAKT
ncbi:tautomerase family protein [Rhodoblastus acidophilus]|uniref:Tautomerase family protein n=1 Tax=Candidatus Rhodoblastus alkanivorans TaxID=2954117 RepID=A0ABS9Z3Y9_9HYPH|nr:2-hydroxymuconate tautomerase [Candidatus Rhodoblastus alkanivorans]MCI4680374.1 tautomerase family protein [Candidatus Rhodoblastus alkanivorans]MCI4682394.1 tautomerase family protein [Candidatus Rhodoblastus alkanivorans]MDI4639699.1 tautomerase family protein [Rhodoblastus acidophilus]